MTPGQLFDAILALLNKTPVAGNKTLRDVWHLEMHSKPGIQIRVSVDTNDWKTCTTSVCNFTDDMLAFMNMEPETLAKVVLDQTRLEVEKTLAGELPETAKQLKHTLECPKCGGKGRYKVPTGVSKDGAMLTYKTFLCDICNGAGRVLKGDDTR